MSATAVLATPASLARASARRDAIVAGGPRAVRVRVIARARADRAAAPSRRDPATASIARAPRGAAVAPPAAISAPLAPTAEASTSAVPTLRELRASIPPECFVPDLGESMKYAALDLAALAACFGLLSPQVVEHPWLLPLYAPLTGTVMWMNFVVGHDCGHGSFSDNKWINAVVGHLTHTPLLVPFWPWAYSHKQHHRFHNHETKDMSHPWMTAEEYRSTNPIVRFLALDHWIGAFLGFPGYLLLEPEWSSTDGSHFYPGSRLFDRAPKDERWKCAVSSAACVGFLLATFGACDGPAQWAAQFLAPYLCFSWWLFTVTYLQHHDEDTKTYGEEEWEYVLGGLETIDREFGFGVDELTHHITDCHVAHHMFSDMPHYRLPAATEGVRGVLEPRGLYKRRDTRDFVAKVFGLHESVGHCIEPNRPRATSAEIKAALGIEPAE